MIAVCAFLGCGGPTKAKGLCDTHYTQQYRGRPLTPTRAVRSTSNVPVPGGFKYCLDCESIKPLSDFGRRATGALGRSTTCRRCLAAAWTIQQYNLPRVDYLALLAAQGGVCDICKGLNTNGRALAVDHDHTCCPGRGSCGLCIRGLLCRNCNTTLGLMEDNPDRLEAAARYVRKGVSR